ncbi:SPOR domain-containing protein [Aureisphaera galaxeae]|uniref:HU domain-containing protein n=1 Tax=Aureisphaera galaxeae TaxID=1538023 RepID=UPI00234FEBC7|nr:SPOR domain-containing protein [Aureisphaera galaxeae]MDC8005037.1 SPOR domain-containing protein [Aureisphaera galaxeae]
MQLASYIKDLLYRYECVIIPGFGAFLTQNHSARIDGASHTFYPPGKTISFNRQLQTNDGILANYVASVENCSYELALQKIRNFTGTVSLELSEGKTVTLKNIGDFFLNHEKTVQFTPESVENFNTASFGLTSFVSPPMQRAEVAEEVQKDVVTMYQEKKKTAYPFLRYAAIGLLAITLGSVGGLKVYEGQVEKHNFAEKQKADALVEDQIQEATFLIDNPLPTLTIDVAKETGKYHIVAGAFRIESNAQKKINLLSQKGFSARLIGKNRYGLHQVVYSSHSERLEALRALRDIKRSENKDAWLLVQDLNR